MIRAKSAWCVRCNEDRPVVKAYIAPAARQRSWVCMVCHERVDRGRAWSAAKATKDITGKMRQSKGEANRGTHLWTLAKGGVITNLRFCNDHPRETFALRVYSTPAVDALLAYLRETGLRDTLRREVDDIERSAQVICHYTPDFSYDDDVGVHHVEDVKGRVSREYPIKKRLMLAAHGIEIEEPDMRRESRRRKRTR